MHEHSLYTLHLIPLLTSSLAFTASCSTFSLTITLVQSCGGSKVQVLPMLTRDTIYSILAHTHCQKSSVKEVIFILNTWVHSIKFYTMQVGGYKTLGKRDKETASNSELLSMHVLG